MSQEISAEKIGPKDLVSYDLFKGQVVSKEKVREGGAESRNDYA